MVHGSASYRSYQSGSQLPIKHHNCTKCIPNISRHFVVSDAMLLLLLFVSILFDIFSLCWALFISFFIIIPEPSCTFAMHEKCARIRFFFFSLIRPKTAQIHFCITFFHVKCRRNEWLTWLFRTSMHFHEYCFQNLLSTIAISFELKGKKINRSISLSVRRSFRLCGRVE